MNDTKVQQEVSGIKEGFIMGLEQALELVKLHRRYGQDLDYLQATIEERLEKMKLEQ